MSLYKVGDLVRLHEDEETNPIVEVTIIIEDSDGFGNMDHYEGVDDDGNEYDFINDDVTEVIERAPIPADQINEPGINIEPDTWGWIEQRPNIPLPRFVIPDPVPEPRIRENIIAIRDRRHELLDATTIPNLNAQDYNATIANTRFLFFTLTENGNQILLHPETRTFSNDLRFVDQFGNIWINEHQERGVAKYRNVHTFQDHINQHWIRESSYIMLEMNQPMRGKVEVRKKKKLRYKYDKMPVIKEEKYYAGKQYIA